MASPTQRTWVCTSSGREWRTGRPGALWSMRLQRVRQNLATEQQTAPTECYTFQNHIALEHAEEKYTDQKVGLYLNVSEPHFQQRQSWESGGGQGCPTVKKRGRRPAALSPRLGWAHGAGAARGALEKALFSDKGSKTGGVLPFLDGGRLRVLSGAGSVNVGQWLYHSGGPLSSPERQRSPLRPKLDIVHSQDPEGQWMYPTVFIKRCRQSQII